MGVCVASFSTKDAKASRTSILRASWHPSMAGGAIVVREIGAHVFCGAADVALKMDGSGVRVGVIGVWGWLEGDRMLQAPPPILWQE